MLEPSRADLFFRDLFAAGSDAFKVLDSFITDQKEEAQWLEFKEAGFFDAPLPTEKPLEEQKRRSDSVKKYWSEGLSAFANSGGGVLVWGIKAPNCKAERRSFPLNAVALAERLRQLQNDAVDPPVPGVEVREVLEPSKNSGFVVCLVPSSSFAPHKAIHADREYYIRSGDSNRSMPTAVLRRMFHPHAASRLVPLLRLICHAGADGRLQIQVSVKLENRGSASAQESYVEARVFGADRVFRHYKAQFWSERPYSQNGYVCENPIHPGEIIPLLNNWTSEGGFANADELPASLRCYFRIFTLHGIPITAEATFLGSELRDAAKSSKPIDREGILVPIP